MEYIGEPFPEHWQKALQEFYDSWGVGAKVEQRKAFWNKLEPDTNVTHAINDEHWVKVLEYCWLTDKFPEEMIFC